MLLTPSQEKALKTKGDGTKTFEADPKLAKLQVPPLEQTLAKYLDSVRPFVTEQELETTKQNCEKFLLHDGRELHSRLCNRAIAQGKTEIIGQTSTLYLRGLE